MKESVIESADRDYAKARGCLMLKFISPGRNSVPDDILLQPVPPEHRETVARYFRFVEYKRPGAVPRASQQREHDRLRAMGFVVDVIDSPGQLKVPM
jgi:hypothetical protein